MKFAYIPKNDMLIHGPDQPVRKRETGRGEGPDYSRLESSQPRDSQDHVLVLEFGESVRGQKADNP